MKELKTFEDLDTWKYAHKLVLDTYRISSLFPKIETYALTDQMRRSSISISSNIAEGFGRFKSRDKLHFYRIAQSSVFELQSQMHIARDVKYINQSQFDELYDQSINAIRLINGLIRSTSKHL